MPTRREFLGAMTLPVFAGSAAATLSHLHLPASLAALSALGAHHDSPDDAATDEDFWSEVARAFTVDRSLINLNNGGVSPAPLTVQRAMQRRLDEANSVPPPVALWETAPPEREAIRARLAQRFGCDTEEIAITRNASEGLQTCQFGLDLQRGDEILTTNQDYPRMLNCFLQRQQREGLVLRRISLPIPCEDDDEAVRRFEDAVTDRTRVILVSHMINITGQILPVARIVAMARRHDIPVIIDGAHALAHVDFDIRDLDCDYYATSLHKWLFAPIGTGLLYVRRDKIKSLWPLMAAPPALEDDIRKFEEIGTHPAANFLAIAEALALHDAIGPARKQARLIHLRNLWVRRLTTQSRIRLHTSLKPGFSCGIATVEITGEDPVVLQKWLWKNRRILTAAITHDEFRGLRISPSVYTSPQDLDVFCEAIEYVVGHGVDA